MEFKLSLLCMVLFIASCSGQKAEFKSEGANYFGAKISEEGALAMSEAVAKLTTVDTAVIKISGTIEEVCQAKGCWMTLQADRADNVFIKFLDYAFFVPKDAAGKKAVVEGTVYNNVTSVDELRHYAEDKGKSASEIAAITEPKKELRMMAEGVIIYND